ncbi:hypothetical protein [Kiloniella litopenaei]|uniref:golvesin C-terminal-like domain-containing protein n=1 Tax=Kiloniella litopenaei TaxID=1549748 RepID=UPI003BA8D011
MHNQQKEGGRWKSLGSYDFVPGQNHRIEMRNADTGKTAVADAIYFEWLGDNTNIAADAG